MGSRGFLLVFSAKLQPPSEREKIDELCNTQETKASAKASQTPEGGDEVLDGVYNVLIVLDDALVFEVHVEKGQVLFVEKLILLILP